MHSEKQKPPLHADTFRAGEQAAAMKDPEKSGLRSSTTNHHDMSQTITLFKKYLLTRPQNNIFGRTNIEESEMIKNSPSDHALSSASAPNCDPRLNINRPSTLLERMLLPQIMRGDGVLPSLVSADRSPTAQLTIFYDGAINVYDNVPVDKAQAIMLLAGESSSPNITNAESPNIHTEAAIHESHVTPRSKLKAVLPLARRNSLQCFFQKRRDRKLMKKSPSASHASPSSRNKVAMAIMNEGFPTQNHGVSLSPFPSRLARFLCCPKRTIKPIENGSD